MWGIIQGGSPSLITDIIAAVNSDISNSERNEFEGKWNDENFQEFFPGINLNDKEVEQEFNVTVVQGSLEDVMLPTPTPSPTPPPYNPNLPGPPNIGQGQ